MNHNELASAAPGNWSPPVRQLLAPARSCSLLFLLAAGGVLGCADNPFQLLPGEGDSSSTGQGGQGDLGGLGGQDGHGGQGGHGGQSGQGGLGGQGGHGGQDGHGGSDGLGGHGGGAVSTCEGDPTQDPALVADACGVFVSASAAPGGDGSRARPFRHFSEAAAQAPQRIFACAETYAETEALHFTGGVALYGGFTDCAGDWTWSSTARAILRGPADKIALTLTGGENHLESLSVVAADATLPGGSSIAVLVDGGSFSASRADLSASKAANGAAGESSPDDANLDGIGGADGVDMCDGGSTNLGPLGGTKTCPAADTSTGGKGGNGGTFAGGLSLFGGNGAAGSPANPNAPGGGLGGDGQGHGDPPATPCRNGAPGTNGSIGESGAGASGLGALSASGYTGVSGQAGTSGHPGQGGGGGGGTRGAETTLCGILPVKYAGAAGGAGGTGGCGGQGGGGGQAGGSSIALLVLEAAVQLADVTLSAGKAGSGGIGGDGQNGGMGGIGGDGAEGAWASCRGGMGGMGGMGGPGGGGRGGLSLGIALRGTTTPVGGDFAIDPLNRGLGGHGGSFNTTPSNGKGDDGFATVCWNFTSQVSCAP